MAARVLHGAAPYEMGTRGSLPQPLPPVSADRVHSFAWRAVPLSARETLHQTPDVNDACSAPHATDAKQDQHTTARRAESARQIVTATNNGSDCAVEFPLQTAVALTYISRWTNFKRSTSLAFLRQHAGSRRSAELGGLMQTVLLCFGGWIAANLIIAGMWAAFRLRRTRTADGLMHSVFRRA